MGTTLMTEREGAIAVLTLNRPDKLNALNAELLGELDAALGELSRDASIACAILTGAGEKAFAAGATPAPTCKGLFELCSGQECCAPYGCTNGTCR
jgi:enoyl-CoA hydratase/carnithine racemase